MKHISNEIIHKELQESIDTVYNLMSFIEDSEEFGYVDIELREHFYHLYIKAKRNFKAINILLNSKELENGYVESTVLLRVMTECYFHLCYLMKSDKTKLLSEYQILKNRKLQQMVRKGTKFSKTTTAADFKEIKSIRKKLGNKTIKIPGVLNNMRELARETDNEVFYNAIYSMFNTYVHFNPTTSISYGSEDQNGIFKFNSLKPKPLLEARVLYYAVTVQMVLLNKILNYINVELMPTTLSEGIENWIKFRDTRSEILLKSSDDYL